MAATALPFAIWLMKNFMDGVPVELEEAAWTDGASHAGPAADRAAADGPGLAVVTIYTFIDACGATSSSPSCCCCPRTSCRRR